MSEHTKTSVRVGPGVLGCLTIVFVIAKLTGHLDWSWWFVFAPLWAPWALLFGGMLLVGLLAGVCAIISGIIEYRSNATARARLRKLRK